MTTTRTTTTTASSAASFIAALDVGTTTIRCHIVNSSGVIVGSAKCPTKLIYPQPGYVEIVPSVLMADVRSVVTEAITDAKLRACDVTCMGVSTQRATFVTWRRDTGEPLHNFITWKDLRAKKLVRQLNSSLIIKTVRSISYIAYLLTRNDRYLSGSKLRIASYHAIGRLLWVLDNMPAVKHHAAMDNVMFGTIDTWLTYEFTNRTCHVTDVTNASATVFYDPFVLDWGVWATKLLGVPATILPRVVANDHKFGQIDAKYFGAPITLGCTIADQNASMFASCCFNENDLKVTIGTGAFLNVNTAGRVHGSAEGMYPLVGWHVNDELLYIGETACYDSGSLIEWLIKAGIIEKASDTEKMAENVPDSDGVHFIPAFSGLGPPIDNITAASGFLGIKPTTTRNHMTRAVLESIVYRITLSYFTLKTDRGATAAATGNFTKIVIDGGVSRNDFVCQLLANHIELSVERLLTTDMTALGAGFIAGLACGVWPNKETLSQFRHVDKVFQPTDDKLIRDKCKVGLEEWLKAVERFKSWYGDD